MSWRPLLSGTWGLLLLCSLPSCSSSADAGLAPEGPKTPTLGAPNDAAGPTVAFADTRLEFVPGDVRRVTATVTPPGVYDVSFSLAGDFGDAFLDQSEVQSSADGTASAMLTAPSSAAAFTVRATVSGASATLEVSAGSDFVDLRVVPHYAGHRTVTTWTATARTGSSCAELFGAPPPDGSLVANAAVNDVPVVRAVPVGVPLTVTLRAGHFAGGCTDLDAAVAGVMQNSVGVTVMDRPLQMGGVNLAVSLGVEPTPGSTATWANVASDFAASFAGNADTDARSLLDAMYDSIPAGSTDMREAFSAARLSSGWDEILVHSLPNDFGRNGLRGLVTTWVEDVFPALATAAVQGQLSSRTGLGFGSFDVAAFAGQDPTSVGLAAPSTSSIPVTWSAAPGDQVLFGGTPNWPLASLAGALVLTPARARVSDAKTVPDALSRTLSCTEVATLLAPASTSGSAYAGCDATCTTALCDAALVSMWHRATHAPGATLVDFAATAAATVDDDARPASFDGTWVGSIRVGNGISKITGPATSD